MSNIGYNSSLGLRASAPNVPAKSVNSLTNNQGSPTTQIAVLHQVAPNNNNPSTASVLIQNRFPPVPGFALPSGFGPVFTPGQVGAPVNGPFVNNPTTMEGGSFVMVDTVTNTVIGLQQGVSTQFPSSATTQIANHVHTGAIDESTGFPMPEQVDLVSHVTSQLTKPNYAEMPTLTTAVASNITAVPDHVGYPIYNVSIIFSLDSSGTTASPWLNQIQIVAIPTGSYQDLNHGTGKILFDTVGALAPGTDYTGAHVGGAGATYRVYVGGLAAGTSYNIYVVYLDYYGNTSLYGPYTSALLYTSGINDVTINNLPGLGIIPPVTFESVAYSGGGGTTFNANVKFDVNYTGTNASQWLQEIRLYATLWDKSANGGNGGPYSYTQSNAGVNLLQNPNAASGLTDWASEEARPPGVGGYAYDSFGGGRFIVANDGGGQSIDSLLIQTISVPDGSVMTVSGIIQIDEFNDTGAGAIIGVDILGVSTGIIDEIYYTSVQGPTPFTFTFTVPTGSGGVEFRMHVRNSTGGTGTMRGYFSGLTLEYGSQSAPVEVNIIGPNDTTDQNQTYFAEWPALSLGNGIDTQFAYQLSLTFVSENGDQSPQAVLCVTDYQQATMYRPAMAAIPSTPPNASLVGSAGFPYDGNPFYDCEFVFQTDNSGTQSDYSLNYIQLVAYPVGADISATTNGGKILYDIISPLRNGYDYNGNAIGTSGSRYHAYVGGLAGGTSYYIAIIYVDFAGNKSSPTVILTTGPHPVTNNNLPGVGILPGSGFDNLAETPASQSQFNAMVAFHLDYGISDASIWLQEIELYANLWDHVNNRPYLYPDGVTYATPILVNIIAATPLAMGGGVEHYIGEYPSLGIYFPSSNSPATWNLGFRYVAKNGSKSDNSANNGVYGHSDPTTYLTQTDPKLLTISRPALSTISSSTTPSVTLVSSDYPFDGNPLYDAEFVFNVDSSGTTSNTALNFIQLVAYPVGSDISSSSNGGKILYDVISPLAINTDYTGATITGNIARYHGYVGGLAGGTSYNIAIIYTDYSGGRSQAAVILTTGTHPVTNNNLPGIGTLPSVAGVGLAAYSAFGTASPATQATFNAVQTIQVNYTGSDAIVWLQEIELWACLWDPSADHPLLYGDGVSYASPFQANTIAALPLSSGTENYLAEYPGLQSYLTSQVAPRYKLGVRFIAKNGAKSDNSAHNGVYGHSDPVTYIAFTSAASISITRPALAQMPTNFVPTTPTSKNVYMTQTKSNAQFVVTFTADSNGYKDNPWLDKIRVFACNTYYNLGVYLLGYGDGNASTQPYNPLTIDGTSGTICNLNNANIYQLVQSQYDITPQESGAYQASFTLPAGNFYEFFVAYLDHSGRMSCPTPIGADSVSGNNSAACSGFGCWCGFFMNFTSGSPTSYIATSASTSTISFIKSGTIYNALTSLATGSASYSQVQFVDFWLIATSGGSETGGALQKQRMPVTESGIYSPVFVNLTLSAVYHIYFQYIAYGESVNQWASVDAYFKSATNTYLTMTVPSS